MSISLRIAIAEPSVIVRSGLENVMKRLPGFRIQLIEIATAESLRDLLRVHKPDLLILNPVWLGYFLSVAHLKEESGCQDMKCLALVYMAFDVSLLRSYDEQISIGDSLEDIRRKLEHLCRVEEEPEELEGEDNLQTLSQREKEIVICIVKGMTNREIADRLCLSTHTVITHRRNIARKLQIHSVSGLTIYAIVNKLVELSDIKQ